MAPYKASFFVQATISPPRPFLGRLLGLDDVELLRDVGVRRFLDPVKPGLVARKHGLGRVSLVALVAAQPAIHDLLQRIQDH